MIGLLRVADPAVRPFPQHFTVRGLDRSVLHDRRGGGALRIGDELSLAFLRLCDAVLLTQTLCRFPSRFSTSPWPGDTPDSRASARRFAAMATRCSICRAPDPLRCLALLGEPLSQILLPAEVHLVRRASSENGARDLLVVLTDVERDETPHRRRTVEGVQEEPRVFQLSPERLDQGVRGDDVDLREHAMQRT